MSLFSNPGFGDGRSTASQNPQPKTLRLAAHTRAGYEQALATALSGVSTAAALDALTVCAAGYSESDEGFERVQRDAAAADAEGQFERAAALRQGLTKGQAAREANRVARQAATAKPAAAQARKPVLGQHAMKNWDPEEPIWPKREQTDEIIASTKIPASHDRLAQRAFKVLYSQIWRSCFYPDRAAGTIVYPYNDEEGWGWRRFSISSAERQFIGAHVITPAELAPGMTVFNGFGIRTVKTVDKIGSAQLARESGLVTVDTYRVTYMDGQSDKSTPADTPMIHLPAIDIPDPSKARTAPGGSNASGATGSSTPEKNKPLDFS